MFLSPVRIQTSARLGLSTKTPARSSARPRIINIRIFIRERHRSVELKVKVLNHPTVSIGESANEISLSVARIFERKAPRVNIVSNRVRGVNSRFPVGRIERRRISPFVVPFIRVRANSRRHLLHSRHIIISRTVFCLEARVDISRRRPVVDSRDIIIVISFKVYPEIILFFHLSCRHFTGQEGSARVDCESLNFAFFVSSRKGRNVIFMFRRIECRNHLRVGNNINLNVVSGNRSRISTFRKVEGDCFNIALSAKSVVASKIC